jgi:hypothetical protein
MDAMLKAAFDLGFYYYNLHSDFFSLIKEATELPEKQAISPA